MATILRKGSQGDEVKKLQTLLIARGYSCGGAGADGDFGNGTLTAVKQYQKDNNLVVDGIVGNNTWNLLLQDDNTKAVYKKIGVTHVVEVDPMKLQHLETQKSTNCTPFKNFVNSVFFMLQRVGGCFPLGMIASDGKIIQNYATHGKPVATLIVHNDGSVEMRYITDLSTVEDLRFAVSGYGIYPNITAANEGFVGEFSDVLRTTNRPIIGYRKSDNKVVIAVRSSSGAQRAKETAKNLGLDFAISLDAGGSTTLKVNGKYIFKGDGRQLWGGITWE